MKTSTTNSETISDISRRDLMSLRDIMGPAGLMRPRELLAHGVTAEQLRRRVKRGEGVRLGRGLYSLPDAPVTEHHGLAEVAKRVPRGIVCLASALAFHGLTTQAPPDVWLMVESRARAPRLDWPLLRLFRASGAAFTVGVEEYPVEGVTVRVTGVAKTVADAFRYRHKAGLDLALEALRECLREKRCSRDDLHRFARVCGVETVMRPYLEALT